MHSSRPSLAETEQQAAQLRLGNFVGTQVVSGQVGGEAVVSDAEPMCATSPEYRGAKGDTNGISIYRNVSTRGRLRAARQFSLRNIAAAHFGGGSSPNSSTSAQKKAAGDPARDSYLLLRCDLSRSAALNHLPSIGVRLVGQKQ